MTAPLAERTGIHMAIAFVAMGGWGLFANWSHPVPTRLAAGLVQGAISAGITFALKRGLDTLRAYVSRDKGWWLPPLVMCSLALGVLIGLHLMAGTPEILATISVPFAVSTSYAVLYNLVRWRKGQFR